MNRTLLFQPTQPMKQNQRKCENKNGFRVFGEIMASHENILVLPVFVALRKQLTKIAASEQQ
jgi:hypothetical protein